MRAKLVVGNWKMNGGLAANSRLLDALVTGWPRQSSAESPRELAVCVPFPYLGQAQAALSSSPVGWGAQDVSAHVSGAYTGEVSAGMLIEFGCRYALAGHSERRQLHGETDAMVAAKASAALDGGITPIVCVGETLAEREAGATATVVTRQFDAVADTLGSELARIVLAYEPVWAIGTGRTASPAQAQEVHALLRKALEKARAGDVRVLYGGSVKAANAKALFAMHDVDGGLVGGASLDAEEFLAIARA
ncbi:MAG TPA: triose-phosphate isomerase [Casimicrobiaceae bacterium]|nr:triose-phosphate isomerase [Casimicrobiaceae bacterium]